MNTKIIITILAVALVAVAAFWYVSGRMGGTEVGADVMVYAFTDETGESIFVTFDNEAQTAKMNGAGYPDTVFTQAISASGARYVNEEQGLVLWNKGDEITLYKDDEPVFSGSTSAATGQREVEETPEPPADGTEPGPAGSRSGGEADLVNSSWNWRYTDLLSGERVNAPAGDRFILSFDADRVSSRTDCNGMGGNYAIDGEVLSMGQFVMTMMYCEGSMEGVYGEQLGLVNSYVIEGDTLRLNLNRGYGTMVFERHQ